jgi:hypothetical protein
MFVSDTTDTSLPLGSKLHKQAWNTTAPQSTQCLSSFLLRGTSSTTGDILRQYGSEQQEELSNAENIFVIGYSLPETDAFFRHLYALGSLGDRLIKRFWVFDLDRSGSVESRFRAVLGKAALSRFKYSSNGFPYGFEADIRTVPP